MALPLPSIGSSCWRRKYGAQTLTAKRLSKSSTVMSSNPAALEIPAFDTTMSSRSPIRLRGKPVGAVRGGEVGGDSIGVPAGRANLADDRLGFIGVATVVDDDARAGGGKRERGRTAHSARPAGDESGLVGEAGHGGISPGNVTSRRGTVHTSLASSVISAFRALETGQFFSASPAIRANVAWSRFGTLARSDKAERVMRKP